MLPKIFNIFILLLPLLKFSFEKKTNRTVKHDLCIDTNFILLRKSQTFHNKNTVACATFYDSEGWHIFSFETYSGFENTKRSMAAGYLEGFINMEYIDYHYANINDTIFHNIPLNEKSKRYVFGQLEYMKELCNMQDSGLLFLDGSENNPEYLEAMKIFLYQFEGMYMGYLARKLKTENKFKTLSYEEFYLITMQGDLEDIMSAFSYDRILNGTYFKGKECSGFVKYVKETNNLIVGHTTHNLYTLMCRVYKYYNLNITLSTGKKLNGYKFSSRPADLTSKDDYYVLSNKMVVLETSLSVINKDLYKNLNYRTIPKWMRVNLANLLANNNQEWIDIFFKYNSGTHNNQWLIIDYKELDNYTNQKSENNAPTPKNIVHIVEQTPLLERKYYEDFSEILLNNSYVASYNAPYFQEVIDIMGYGNAPWNQSTYFTEVRYSIFKELQSNVFDLDSGRTIMRYHKKGDVCTGICPRCDLSSNTPFGGIDSKMIDSSRIEDMKSTIIFGPSHIEGSTEPFDFRKWPNFTHYGIPDISDFKWIDA